MSWPTERTDLGVGFARLAVGQDTSHLSALSSNWCGFARQSWCDIWQDRLNWRTAKMRMPRPCADR